MVKRTSKRRRQKNRYRRVNHSRKMIGGLRNKAFQAKILKVQTSKNGPDLLTDVKTYAVNDMIIVEKDKVEIKRRAAGPIPPPPPAAPGVPQPNPLPATPEMDETYVKVNEKNEWILVKREDTANPPGIIEDGFLEYKNGIFQPNIFSAKIKEDDTNSFHDDAFEVYNNFIKDDIVTVDTTTAKKARIDGVDNVDIFQNIEDTDEWFRKVDLEFIDDPEDFVVEIEVFPYDSEEDKNINNSGYRIGDVKIKYTNSTEALSSTDVVHNYLRKLLGIADEYQHINTWANINDQHMAELLKSDKIRIVFKPTPVDQDKIPDTGYNRFKKRYNTIISNSQPAPAAQANPAVVPGGGSRTRIHNLKRSRTKRRKTSRKKYI